MKVPLNDLARAARTQADDLASVFSDVAASGWFVQGPQHGRFEEQLALYLGTDHAVGLASGTDALELAIRATTNEPERDVIINVANAGGYTTCAAVAAGRRVRYCDVSEETHTMDPRALEPLLDRSVGAVVVTHLYGRMADIRTIKDMCGRQGIPVIEDCAQSLGARDNEGMAGAVGDISTFSFYPTKNLGALGDGGAVATNDEDLARKVRELRQYGWNGKYHNVRPGGRNSRLDELQAAFLSLRLRQLDGDNEVRRSIIASYVRAAPDAVRVLPADGPHHVAHLAVAVTDDARALAQHLAEQGIGTDVHYPTPDHRQPAWTDTDCRLPVTDSLMGRVVSLPCFPQLTTDEIAYVCHALSSYQE